MNGVRSITRLISSGLAIGASSLAAHASDAVMGSDPVGAFVRMQGVVSVAGMAPLPVGELPTGEYTFRAEGPGLPAVRGRFAVASGSLRRLAWTGPTAFLYPPGLAHLERGERRGWTFLASGLVGGGMYLRARSERSEAQDEIAAAEAAYASAVSLEGIRSARDELELATTRRDDEEELSLLWAGFAGASWLGAAIETWLLTPEPHLRRYDTGDYSVRLPRAAGWKAAVRSALVPGAGQRYAGRNTHATLFTAGVVLAGGAAIVAQESFLDARREQALEQARYDRASTPAELDAARARLSDAAEKADDRNALRWTFVGTAAAIYAWNVLDAWLSSGSGAATLRDADGDFSLGIAPSVDGLRAAATWSIR